MKTSLLTRRVSTRVFLMAAALAFGTTAWASVDTTPRPGGVYKLKPGVYVDENARCEGAPNGAIRKYDGRSIATTHSLSCQVNVRSRKGNRYVVDQSCRDTRVNPGRRTVERQRITVSDALTFTQTVGGQSTTYRYCPVYRAAGR